MKDFTEFMNDINKSLTGILAHEGSVQEIAVNIDDLRQNVATFVEQAKHTDKEKEALMAENAKLKSQNMDLFLRVPVQGVSKPEDSIPANKITIDDLFK